MPGCWPRPPQEFLTRFAPHAGTLNPPEFPSNYLPKAAAPAEGAAAAAIPEKLQFNFFVPHETVCQSEKVRAGPGVALWGARHGHGVPGPSSAAPPW